MMNKRKPLAVYLHIPFCRSKCKYCDFLSFGGLDETVQAAYGEALCREIRGFSGMALSYSVSSIFFGGGTPSYVKASVIEKLLCTVREVFVVDRDCEITLEGNPDSLTADKLKVYRQIGINRLSIGLQSLRDDLLKTLGRVHDRDQFMRAYAQAREAGFSNINVDLMSGLPGESGESYLKTLEGVLALKPEHISAYSLIVEEGTPLSEDEQLLALLPGEEEDRLQYRKTKELLRDNGYERYEISNYARKGFACRHNRVYWTMGEYLGLGLGASSFLGLVPELTIRKTDKNPEKNVPSYKVGESTESGVALRETGQEKRIRFRGEQDLTAYLECFGAEAAGCSMPEELIRDKYQDIVTLNRKDEIEEYMFLGLRMINGISRRDYRQRFGQEPEVLYGDVIRRYLENGLLLEKEDRLFLSDRGLDVSNVVMADFLLDRD